jgi:hypothetical protein
MINLRALLFGLLVVALLPWGAWLSAAAARPQPLAVTAQKGEPVVLRAAHRCRTALLPGQSCGQEPGLLPPVLPLGAPGTTRARPPLAIVMGTVLLPDTATPPPRVA